MSNNCNSGCNCNDEKNNDKSTKDEFIATPHELSNIKKVIGVVSGKGGVGKSLVTSLLAVNTKKKGYNSAILDADITGPSIPKAFGIKDKVTGNEFGLFPNKSKSGIQIMSTNLLLDNDTDPVVWRGPILANTVKQFWSDVIWHDVDFMFIDMPPGTGDVPLTVFQSISIDGIIIVTSPQELVSMIVSKAVKMAEMMKIPIIGLIENMSYFKCPDCDKIHNIFGDGQVEKTSEKYNIEFLGKIPIDPKISNLCDQGTIESYENNFLNKAVEKIEQINRLKKEDLSMIKIAVASENENVTEHFGHCKNFNIFEIENNQITKTSSIDNPGHKPGFLPKFLNEKGVNIIISGGMGKSAIDIFNQNSIKVITGAVGNAKSIVEEYLKGSLKSTNSVCHEHKHHDDCEG
ncbi:MAG: iron-sulfur cluster carrier protein MrpORP [Clostridiales bacterium]